MSQVQDHITSAVAEYTGDKVVSLALWEDPRVEGTYAVRAWVERKSKGGQQVIDFLLVSRDLPTPLLETKVERVSRALEEVEFAQWPPRASCSQP